jgi:hypothetical protein
MMTLCINYKAQLAVTNFGPRHTTHFVLVGWVKGPIKANLPPRMMSRVFTMLIFRPYPKCGIYLRRVWPAGVVGACLRGKDIVPVRVVVSY